MQPLITPEEGGAIPLGGPGRAAESPVAIVARASAAAAAPAAVSRALLALLLSTDGLFIALHLVYLYSRFLQDFHFSVEMDWGHGDVFQMVKEYWAFALLVALFLRTRRPVHGAWSLVLGYVLLDDAVQIHERGGGKIVEWFGYAPAFQLRAQDFGELTVTVAAGLGLAVAMGGAWLLSDREDRRVARRLTALLGLLFFFGVIVDMLHVVRAWPLLGLLEDGGEMLAMSLICWYVFRLFGLEVARPTPPPGPRATR